MSIFKPRLVIPKLELLYAAVEPWGYACLRLAVGVILMTYGFAKLFGGRMTREVETFHHLGLEPANILVHFIGVLEFFGGLMIAVGLLTRPIAAMLVVEMLVIIVMVMIPRGGGTGYQLTVVWLGAFLYMLARGGDRVSIDGLLSREF